MRPPPIPPDRLSAGQRQLQEDVRAGVAARFKGLVSERADGALVGPLNPMLAVPGCGEPAWQYTEALAADPTLPRPAREVAILATGARFNSRYEP